MPNGHGHAEHGGHGHEAPHGHAKEGGGENKFEIKDLAVFPLLKKLAQKTIASGKQLWGLIKEMGTMMLSYATDALDSIGEIIRQASWWGLMGGGGGRKAAHAHAH